MLQAVILVGGRGTRLGPLTDRVPKPLLNVGGRPFLEYLIENLIRYGVGEVLLLVGYKGGDFYYLCEPGFFEGCKVKLSFDGEILKGTGGSLKAAKDFLENEFLLLNGDTFFDINFSDFRRSSNCELIANLALRAVDNRSRYNSVFITDGLIKGFVKVGEIGSGLINGGVYYLKKTILDFIPDGVCSLETDVFPELAQLSLIGAKVFERPFLDIGIPDDFESATRFLNNCYYRPAVFFDRDGVLNRDIGYLYEIEKFQWIDGAIEAIKYFNDKGFFVFVVSNQSGVARGFYTEKDVLSLHKFMNSELLKHGAHIDRFEYCPFHPDGIVETYRVSSSRRKPEPGMILGLLSTWPIKKEKSFLIGDQDSDIEAALASDIRGFKFEGNNLFEFVKNNNL